MLLPSDVFLHTLLYADMDVIKNVMMTNKQFYQLTDDLYFWTCKFKIDQLYI